MQRVACIVDEVNAVRGQKYVGWRAIFSAFSTPFRNIFKSRSAFSRGAARGVEHA
jgi:hypothetical protein